MLYINSSTTNKIFKLSLTVVHIVIRNGSNNGVMHRSFKYCIQNVFWKKRSFSATLQNSQENTCARASFLTKLEASVSAKRETVAQVFPCEFCEVSKNTFLQNTSGPLPLSWREDRTFHYKVPFSLSFSTSRKSCSGSNLGKRCSIHFMFSRLHFKLWKINTPDFLEKI